MRLSIDCLGKVAITVEENQWSNVKDYRELTIVEAPNNTYKTYISRKPVPAGTALTDRNYWIPFSSLDEQIVLDFNSFAALWTDNLAAANHRIDGVNETILKKEHDLYLAIASIVQGGVALMQSFGDSEVYGISQKVLTEKIDDLQDQINRLHPGSIGIEITVSPNVVYQGTHAAVTVVARMINNQVADTITIIAGNETYTEHNVVMVEHEFTIEQTTNIVAEALQTGFTYENNVYVNAVNPIYAGSAANYNTIYADAYKQTIRLTPAGTYNITVPENGDKVYFIVPSNMTITRATMSGFEFPLDDPQIDLIEGYKIYASSNTYDAGNLIIVIS